MKLTLTLVVRQAGWAALAVLLACVIVGGAAATTTSLPARTTGPGAEKMRTGFLAARERQRTVAELRHLIRFHRRWTWLWESRAGLPRTPTSRSERRQHSVAYLRWVTHYWRAKHAAARRAARDATRGWVPSWFNSQATCVHGGEGAWNADTGNGFGGGLQFMVGTWNGAASHSGGRVPRVKSTGGIAAQPPRVQIYAAYVIVVLEHDGWGQWPTTARACGLL